MEMTPQRWEYTSRYSQEVFGAQDDHLAGLMTEAVAEGLPPIAVSADVGRLLQILTSMTSGRLAIEIGTLGGYSGIWITRGLRSDGRLITIEYESRHARFARAQFERAGLGSNVEVRVGAALDVLPSLIGELEPGSVDVVFLDAVKSEYTQYFEAVKPLVAVGGLVLADNVYGTGEGWIDQGHGTDAFNRLIASDPDFEAVAVPLREGVLIALRIS
ncbi:MAG: O-methyltransferase [Acidimicrobiia bacterium]